MCINPIQINTRTRYLSLLHRQPLVQWCDCGKCWQCQQKRHNDMYYRIYHEWLDTVRREGGYVFFDTLTYSDENLPHVSDFFELEDWYDSYDGELLDFACFSRRDLRGFVTRLESRLRYHYNLSSKDYKRFICAEYGTSSEHTHRPHYHLLFFVKNPCIDVFTLRELIHDCWNKGITDKVRIKGKNANYFVGRNNRSELAVSNYVAKYVQKDSVFQDEIDRRIGKILFQKFGSDFTCVDVSRTHVDVDNPDHVFVDEIRLSSVDSNICFSYSYSLFRQSLYRTVGQFHLQSQNFGLCALDSIDMEDLFNTGLVYLPDCQKVVRSLSLPKYFERKLFERQVLVNGRRCWVKTDKGKLYYQKKHLRVCLNLAERYRLDCLNYGIVTNVNFDELACYVMFRRGRMCGSLGNDVDCLDVLSLPSNFIRYNYSTPLDRSVLGGNFVSSNYIGDGCGYTSLFLENAMPFDEFVSRHAMFSSNVSPYIGSSLADDNRFEQTFEVLLQSIADARFKDGYAKQELYDSIASQKNKIKKEKRCHI